jgi:predicted TIM-barrel fold metal-dependent hydrolase
MSKTKSDIADLFRAGRPLDHTPVVDLHCHLGASSEYYYIPRSVPSQVVAGMDRYGLDHIVTFSINTSTDHRPGNNLQYAAAQAFPGRISALTMLNGKFIQDWPLLLDEGVKNGSRGIKLISQYQGVCEEDIDWSPAFDYAKDKKWLVLHHFWGTPERLERWAKNYPGLTFVIGHACTQFKKAIEKYDNVYQCTCACFAMFMCSFKDMYDTLPPEKILYGSDALDLDFGTGLGPIVLGDIPEKHKEMILGQNAMTLFKKLKWNLK